METFFGSASQAKMDLSEVVPSSLGQCIVEEVMCSLYYAVSSGVVSGVMVGGDPV